MFQLFTEYKHKHFLNRGLDLIFVCLLTWNYYSNIFGVTAKDFFETWQLTSENQVINRVIYDELGYTGAPLGQILEIGTSNGIGFVPYESMIGGYSFLLSWGNILFPILSINAFQFGGSLLFALTTVVFSNLLTKITNSAFGWTWLVAVSLSPWLVAAAKNLYWAPWLFLLPIIAAALFSLSRNKTAQNFALMVVFGAFFFKYWATGYEVFTSITIIAAGLPLLQFAFQQNNKLSLRPQMLKSLMILIASGVGLVSNLIIQALLMTGNLETGLKQIWINAVMRRTWGDPENFDPIYATSLTINPLVVIYQYFYSAWTTDLLAISAGNWFTISLGSNSFLLLVIASCLVLCFRIINKDSLWREDFILLLIGFSSAISWFILAKAHSYIHTHILFFLWYLFLIPVVLYIPIRFFVNNVNIRFRKPRNL